MAGFFTDHADVRMWWMVAAVGCGALVARAGPVPLSRDRDEEQPAAAFNAPHPDDNFNALEASPLTAAHAASTDADMGTVTPVDSSPQAAALIPLPPAVWSGAVGLSTLATAAAVRKIRRHF